MKCLGLLPRSLCLIVALLAFGLIVPTVASADAVAVSSASRSGAFYPWCGGQTLLQGLLPDVTPPNTPKSCSDYSAAGSSGTLTVTLGSHNAGSIVTSLYARVDSRPLMLRLYVNGAQAGQAIAATQNHTGWLSFPTTTVSAAAVVSVQAQTGSSGSGYVRIYSVHGELTPPSTPPTNPTSVLGQPGNWATTPVPSAVALDPSLAPTGTPLTTAVPNELAGQAAGDSWVNQTAYTTKVFYVSGNTPLQPVRLCRYSGYCVPNWGSPSDDLWRAAMGEGNSATFDRTGGKPISDQYIGGGIPIDSTVTASPGTDREAVICRGGGASGSPPWVLHNPDGSVFTRPDGQEIVGDCWEVWGLQPDPTYDRSLPISPSNTQWMIQWGARHTGLFTQLTGTPVSTTDPLDTLSGTYTRPHDTTWYGPDVDMPGAPDSTTYDHTWGVTAAQTPLLTDIVGQSDCQAVLNGAADFGHAIGIQLQYSRNPLSAGSPAWWPAGGSDGNAPSLATEQGMRVFFAPNVAMPTGLSRAGQALFHTLQRYGAVIDDQTGGGPTIQYNADGSYRSGGALMIRSELDIAGTGPCGQLGIGSALAGIPWTQISGPIEPGSDANPNPLR